MTKKVTFFIIGTLVLTILPACDFNYKKYKKPTKQEKITANKETKKTKNKIMEEKKMKKENSIKKTDSGLQYQILKTSENDSTPNKGQKVVIHYTGWLSEDGKPGKKFDSSIDRNQPFSFIVGIGQVIKGFDEGILNMKVGEKTRLIIPSNLAYGNRQVGSLIPANSDLIFDIELLEVA